MKVKICGLKSEADVQKTNLFLPDFVGFVFAPFSKRFVSEEALPKLASAVDARAKKVGVFVDATLEEVVRRAEFLDIVQLHGSEDEAFVREVQKCVKKPVIRAFVVRAGRGECAGRAGECGARAVLEAARKSPAELVLLDGGMGDGRAFEWGILRGFGRDFLLAGGVSAANLGRILREVSPFGVDLSSSVEENGGKSETKLREFFEALRSENGKLKTEN